MEFLADCRARLAFDLLTRLGESLLGPIEALGEWAYQYGDEVLTAQDRSTVDGVTSAMI